MKGIKICPKGLNITGMYRECEQENCHTLVSCPFSRCKEHWTAMVKYELSDQTEVHKVDTEGFI